MKLFLKILWATIFISCTQTDSSSIDQNHKNAHLSKQTIDSIVDIPKSTNGGFSTMYKAIKNDEKLLGLDSLQIGFDSLQIRIWFESGRATNKQMLILKNAGGNWNGELVSWTMDIGSENLPKYSLINKKVENVSPKSGWEKFITRLIKLNIITLPDDSNIEGVEGGGGDLRMTLIEIAMKKMYRFYSYTEPDGYSKQFKELQDIENIVRFTFAEFPKLLHPPVEH